MSQKFTGEKYKKIGIRILVDTLRESTLPTEHIDDAQIQQFIKSKIQRPITFSYIPYEYEGLKIATLPTY